MSNLNNSQAFGLTNNVKPFPYERKLTVRTSFYERPYINNRPLEPLPALAPVPWINIKGYWLNQAGFTISTPLVVKVSKGQIVLTAGSL